MTKPALLVVAGASAGGVDALQCLARALPNDLPAAVLVVLHMSPTAHSVLADILDRAGPLEAHQAADGDEIRAGTIIVGPPDRHLIVVGDRIVLDQQPPLDRHRPSIDRLFMSVADQWSGPIIGVVLSGLLNDGVAGLACLEQAGAITLVQDPEEAAHPELPRAVIAGVGAAEVLTIEGIAARIVARAGALHEPS